MFLWANRREEVEGREGGSSKIAGSTLSLSQPLAPFPQQCPPFTKQCPAEFNKSAQKTNHKASYSLLYLRCSRNTQGSAQKGQRETTHARRERNVLASSGNVSAWSRHTVAGSMILLQCTFRQLGFASGRAKNPLGLACSARFLSPRVSFVGRGSSGGSARWSSGLR